MINELENLADQSGTVASDNESVKAEDVDYESGNELCSKIGNL